MQDSPRADELLDAVAAYLFAELRSQVPSEERFRVLVAANVCAVVARELRAGSAPSELDASLFGELLSERGIPLGGESGLSQARDGDGGSAAPATERAEQLAGAIRRGELDQDLEGLACRLSEHVARKLEVARPGYAD